MKKLFSLLENNIKGKTITVLGLSFKQMTDDVRESASAVMIQHIIDGGGKVNAYDPEAMENMKIMFPNIQYFDNWKDAARNSDADAIMTGWHEFRGLDLAELKKLLKNPILLDTRNILSIDKLSQLGYTFDNVGRIIES